MRGQLSTVRCAVVRSPRISSCTLAAAPPEQRAPAVLARLRIYLGYYKLAFVLRFLSADIRYRTRPG
jgi:hypothetical protein